MKHRLRLIVLTMLLWLLGSTSTIPLKANSQATTVNIISVAWSPDGTRIAGSGTNGLLRIWDATTNQVLLDFPNLKGIVSSIAWKPDSTRIASAGEDGTIRIWNASSGQLVTTLQIEESKRVLVAWSPDGSKLAGVACDEALSVRLWTVQYDKFSPSATSRDMAVYSLAWSPVGTRLAVAEFRGVYVFTDFSKANLVGSHIAPFALAITWSPDGTKIATGNTDGSIHIYNARSGQELSVFQGHTDAVEAIAWSPDGSRLASASFDNTARIWNISTRQTINTLSITNDSGIVSSPVAWSPNGNKVAIGNGSRLQIAPTIARIPSPTQQ
jgi:WD40 repeat protein